MSIKNDLQNLILYDRKYIFEELKRLQQSLNIYTKFNEMVKSIDDIDYMYVRNLELENSIETLEHQMIENAKKRLELICVINGEKKYLKSFGLIENISKERLRDLYDLLVLIRLSKKISETSFYASQYYRADNIFDDLSID